MKSIAFANRVSPVLVRPVFRLNPTSSLGLVGSILQVESPNVQISTAFIEDGALVIRIWESTGQKTSSMLDLSRKVVDVKREDFIGNIDATAMVSILHRDRKH